MDCVKYELSDHLKHHGVAARATGSIKVKPQK